MITLILMAIACLCFLLSACGVTLRVNERRSINLQSVGLFFWSLAVTLTLRWP